MAKQSVYSAGTGLKRILRGSVALATILTAMAAAAQEQQQQDATRLAPIIVEGGGTPAGIVIALDRQERVREDAAESAAQAVAAEHGIAVVAVAGLADLLEFAGERAELVGHRDALLAYRARYGIA